MDIEKFVESIRREVVDGIATTYAESLTNIAIGECKEQSMKSILKLWQESSEETRIILKAYIRLGSQNAVSSMLGVIDNVSFLDDIEEEFSLVAISGQTQQRVSGDLLDIFWAQEEMDGRVNAKT